MQAIDIYAYGYCRDENSLSQLSGCGIVMDFIDDHQQLIREYGYSLGTCSTGMAQLQAVRLALASVAPRFRSLPVKLFVPDIQLVTDYMVIYPSERNIIDDLNRWYSYYDVVDMVVADTSHERMARAVLLCKRAIDTQSNYDSSTIIHERATGGNANRRIKEDSRSPDS